MKNIAYIMRGLPGSGKSTTARLIAKGIGAIHSTDTYFDTDAERRFDHSRLVEYHMKNIAAFKESLAQGIPIVICDNTNMQRWEFASYVEAARAADYEVKTVAMPHPHPAVAARLNTHGVPEKTIRRMLKRWEP